MFNLVESRLLDDIIRRQLSAEPEAPLLADDGRVRVLLCGTGSPETSTARAQACTLVATGGRMFLFDAGEGATLALGDAKVDLARLTGVFLTHFHSDHVNGLGAVINAGWIAGRSTPMPVAGPPGVEAIVSSLASAYALDRGYRAADMPDLAADQDAAVAHAVAVATPPGEASVRVYDEAGITIDAVTVDHEPVHPAYGYVVTAAGKKIFISGDTRVVPGNRPAMADADLVVHEAFATHLVRKALPIMRQLGQTRQAADTERTIAYHADTIALATQAQQTGVKHLALTHLTPYPNDAVARRLFTKGMADVYDGEITVGRDGMTFVV